jgi:hypothetical protein
LILLVEDAPAGVDVVDVLARGSGLPTGVQAQPRALVIGVPLLWVVLAPGLLAGSLTGQVLGVQDAVDRVEVLAELLRDLFVGQPGEPRSPGLLVP